MKFKLRVLFVLIVAAAGFAQAWFLGVGPASLAAKSSDGSLAEEYTRALASGHSYLLTVPDPKHPVLDASLHNGRYYLYFSPVPFLLSAVPWLIVTGRFLNSAALILGFNVFGYLAYAACFSAIACRWRRQPRLAIAGLILLGVIVGGGTWPLAAHAAIYEVENAAAFGLFAWSLWALLRVELEGAPVRPIWPAMLLAGLAAACRPNYFPAVAVVVAYGAFRPVAGAGTSRIRSSRLVAPLLPLVAIGLGLAWWNYHRFGSPGDFGVKQFSQTDKQSGLLHTSLNNLPYNLERYLVGPLRLGSYFPFIIGPRAGWFHPARHQEAANQVYGCLFVSPFLLWAILSPLRRLRTAGPLPVGLMWVCAGAGAGNLLYLSLLGFGAYRYPADFLGPFALLAGVSAGAMFGGASRWICISMAALLAATILWSCAGTLFVSTSIAQVHARFDQLRPKEFQILARPFNALVYRGEALLGRGPVSVRLELRFPQGRWGQAEPLVVTGDPSAQDFLYAYYPAPGLLQLGFESMGYGGPVTGPFKLNYRDGHVLEVFFGSFLPPDDHPLLRGLSTPEIAWARTIVRVRLDGRVVIEDSASLHQLHSRILIGVSPDEPAFGRRFTGQLLSVHRVPLRPQYFVPEWRADEFGPLTLRFRLKAEPAPTREPLIALGYKPRAEMLAVDHLADGRARLVWLRSDAEPVYSAPFKLSPGVFRRLELSTDSLYPPFRSAKWTANTTGAQAAIETERTTRVRLDGATVLTVARPGLPVSPNEVVVGRDSIGFPGVSAGFGGEIDSIRRTPWP